MKAVRTALNIASSGCTSSRNAVANGAPFGNHCCKTALPVSGYTLLWSFQRDYSTNELSKNIQLISNDKVVANKTFGFKVSTNSHRKPLVVILPWLLAQQKHVMKFAGFYLKQGFDVLKVSVTPWQLLWPTKGSQLVAEDMLQFLHLNQFYQPLLLHGFSVGAYLWGEALVKIKQDMELYEAVVNRIAGHIWDSAADITELTTGLSQAIFPNNKVLRNALEKYIQYHLKTFHQSATIHYIRASQMYHTSIVRAPALMLFSKTDPIGCSESILRAVSSWESIGIRTYTKCWDKSSHVGHYRAHPEEYMAELYAFLEKIELGEGLLKMKANA